MNKQQLASTIWQSANQMRSKIEANEYKDYILGFMFYKYLSDREISFLKGEKYSDEDIKKVTADDEKLVKHISENIGYFIAYEDLFSSWLSKGDDFDVSDVRDALSNFDANIEPTYKKLFENIFKTLQSGLSKLGETSTKQTKSIKALLKLIKRIPMDGKQDYDVLGFIYEYLISMFAANAGKKAGEFYTPHEVSVLMSEIVANHLKDREHIKIYDPTSGSGSLLINIGASMAQYIEGENKIDYYAQELKENTYNLTRMNLVMRGINPANINVRNGDTLEDDWPFFETDENKDETYSLVKVDAVVSNPPYSQKWDPKNKEFDPRFKEFGVAPKAKADYAFLLHELYHLEDDGIMTIVLPHGVLFRGGEEETIRKTLIERNHIEAIIGLPANIFFGTGIPTIIMQSIGSVMTYCMNRILIEFSSTATAVFGVYFKLQSFFFMPVFGLNNGITPIIAYNYGAGQRKRMLKTIKLSMLVAFCLTFIGFLCFEGIPQILLGMFNASDEMLTIGVPALRIIGIHYLIAWFCIVSGTVFQALGKAFFSMIVSIMRQLFVLIPAAYILAKLGGLHVVWWSFPIAEVISLMVSSFFLVRINRTIISRVPEGKL